MPHLHWVMPDDPLTPLPIEIFMRDYYEPRLLSRILNGEQFKPVNSREVLDKVVGMLITEWQYKEQSDARHIGPLAQDFRAAFSLGQDERHITSVDADGVALAAIQGLNEKLEEKNQEVQDLKKNVEELRDLVNKRARQQKGGAK